MSYSAGSPYAAACAHAIPERLSAVGIVSGVAQPFSAPGATQGMPTVMLWTTARIHPRLTWLLFKMMKNTIANAPRDQLPASAKGAMMAEADFAFIKEHRSAFTSNMDSGLEALRQGGYGPAQAASLYWKPWGFRLEEIQPRVHIWHGEDDLNAPFGSHGKVFAKRLPKAEVNFYPGEGHISLIHKYLGTILETLSIFDYSMPSLLSAASGGETAGKQLGE
jgi:pimeloyl-ACP methyl ester carboxylesterase